MFICLALHLPTSGKRMPGCPIHIGILGPIQAFCLAPLPEDSLGRLPCLASCQARSLEPAKDAAGWLLDLTEPQTRTGLDGYFDMFDDFASRDGYFPRECHRDSSDG